MADEAPDRDTEDVLSRADALLARDSIAVAAVAAPIGPVDQPSEER